MSTDPGRKLAPGAPGARLQPQRQHDIYLMALRHGSVDVSDLARRFAVTTETIRRDLTDLQERQLVRRVHGGAVPGESSGHEPMVDARNTVNMDEKLRIASAAAAEVPSGGSVIIDSGSTAQRLAEVFPVDREVHVVTNSLVTALTLTRRGVREVTVLGGGVRTNTFAMIDSTARQALADIHVDVLFVGCDGLSFQRGLTTPYRDEQAMKRTMIGCASRVVALADESKFGNSQMFAFAALEDIDVVVTDTRVDEDTAEILTGHGVTVVRS